MVEIDLLIVEDFFERVLEARVAGSQKVHYWGGTLIARRE
jgi:hypothetical protein